MTRITADTVELLPATADNAELAGQIIPDTNPALFAYLHGHDPKLMQEHLAWQWQQPRGLFSHTWATLAVHEDQAVGIAMGHNAVEHEAGIGPFAEQALTHLGEATFTELLTRFSLARYVQPAIPEDAWYLHILSIMPEARGSGVGERLLRHTIDRAREQGYASLHLDVYAENPALRIYQRAGLDIIVETTIAPLTAEGINTHYRMAIDL